MKLGEEIINVLDYLCEKFGVAVDWTSENVMPYLESLCEKYIRYETLTSIAWIAIVLAIIGIIAIPLSIVHKKAKASNWDDDIGFAATLLWMIFAVMSLISIIVVCVQVFDIIECYTFPEKTILEYVKLLMNNANR